MVEEKNESTRNLLEQIEGAWDAPGATTPSPGEARKVASPEIQAALDAAADRLVQSLDPAPVSVPTMDELDSGWGEEDDDDDEEDDVEPELPDERLDPVAYAAAKLLRDERIEARRERRRARAETKKARRKARLDAQKQKQKQKGKQKKARAPHADARAKAKADAKASARSARKAAEPEAEDEHDGDAPASAPRARAKAPPSRPMKKSGLSKTNQWMLAIAIGVFLAAAIFAAVVTR
jgi:hypothetical protein